MNENKKPGDSTEITPFKLKGCSTLDRRVLKALGWLWRKLKEFGDDRSREHEIFEKGFWRGQEDDGKETSFLTKAISSGYNLLRAIKLLGFVSAGSLLFVWLIMDKFKESGGQIRISERGSIISVGGKESEIFSVPAYQMLFPTGIKFSKEKIIIRATGSIATGLYHSKSIKKLFVEKGPNEQRLSRLDFNDRTYLGWRDPDGRFIQEYKEEGKISDGEKCIKDESEKKKISPNIEYGALIGVFAKDEKDARRILEKKDNNQDKLLAIGSQATIVFNSVSGKYHLLSNVETNNKDVTNKETAKDFEENTFGDGKKLFLTINDSIVNEKEEFKMFDTCIEKNKKDFSESERKDLKKQQGIYESIYGGLRDPQSIWFMDNKGSFTVTIIKELADKK